MTPHVKIKRRLHQAIESASPIVAVITHHDEYDDRYGVMGESIFQFFPPKGFVRMNHDGDLLTLNPTS